MPGNTRLHRKPAPAASVSPLSQAPAARAGMSSGGSALDTRTQATMSARFGHDFSSVRVHTDARAGQSAEALGANAYAVGSDIVFGPGRYAPGSSDGQRLLAHELTHVAQQAQGGPGDPDRASHRGDASEREADSLAAQVMTGRSVQVQAAPQAALARDENEGGSWLGSLASSAWSGTKSAAGAVYDGYEKATDFKTLQSGDKNEKDIAQAKGHWYEGLVTGGMNGGIDWMEKNSAEGNQKMVDASKGHWYEGLAKGSAWVNNGMTQAVGGVAKGVGDLGFGLVNGIAHPIDALGGIEGILEHNMTIPGLGTTLKAGHGLYDMATGKKDGEYGSTWGELGDHLFNPMTQMKDDAKFDTNLAAGILAPDEVGKKDANGKPIDGGQAIVNAFKDKPVEATARAITNIIPFFLGGGEADAAKAADVGDMVKVGDTGGAAKVLDRPALPAPEPPTVYEPHPFEPTPGGNLKPVTPAPAEFPIPDKPGGGGPASSSPVSPSNGASNAADFERLKADLSQQEIMGAGPKGSALKGGSGDVRSTQVMEPKPALNPDGTPQMNANGTPKMNMEKVDGVRNMGGGVDVDHSAPIYEQDRIAQDGRVFPLENGGKITQMPGGVGESRGTGYRQGIMEYIVDKEGNLVHQQFREGGGVNGEFGGKPEIRPNNGSYYPDDL